MSVIVACPWTDILVEDTRQVIIGLLDPLTRRLFAMTNHSCREQVGQLKILRRDEMIQLLAAHGSPSLWNYYITMEKTEATWKISETMQFAASHGNLENLKWLKKQGCPLCEKTFARAASHGNLENMKWLKKQDCPWTKWTFARAAEHGNLENLKWLKEQGCPRLE
jgi:hypothetical protein